MDRAVHIRCLLVAVPVGIAVAAGLAVADQVASKATFTPPHTRQGAARDAAFVLRSVVLPAGAQRLSREPRGDAGVLKSGGPHEVYADLVDRHAWWRVPGPWRSVLAFVNTHPPPGSRDFTSGSGGTYGRETSAFVVFGWPMTAGSRTRQLTVLVAATPGGATYLRVDADVVWLLRRSASERIPGGVQAIDITRGLPGHAPSKSLTVTDAAKVKLVLLDPVMQRLIAAAQALGYVADTAAGEHQLHSLAAELQRIQRSGSWHDGHPFASKPLKPLRGRQTGATPPRGLRHPPQTARDALALPWIVQLA